MQPARPLRDVFDELVGDRSARGDSAGDDQTAGPAGALADSGHGDLPDQLLSEAIVSYADTAPIEVAEHLAPFVTVHSAVPTGDDAGAADLAAGDGLDLLATAPEPILTDGDGDGGVDEPALDYPGTAEGDLSYGGDPAALDFGFGHGAGDQAGEAVPSIEEAEQDHGVVFEPDPAAADDERSDDEPDGGG